MRQGALLFFLLLLGACSNATGGLYDYGGGGGSGGMGGGYTNTTAPWHVTYVNGVGSAVQGYPPTDGSTYNDGVSANAMGQGSMTWSGWTFHGWNTVKGAGGVGIGGTPYAQNAPIVMTSNVTLYAYWTSP